MKNSFAIDIIPGNDPERVAAMARYRLFDTPAETVFDNMTLLAAATFQTPVALISLVGSDTVFFKSTVGVGKVRCAERGESLCALAILSPGVMVFKDTLAAPQVADSVPVKQGVRFYAGAPLESPDGYLIGTICIADFRPRMFSTNDRKVLETLSRVVMEQMELRLAAMNEVEAQKQLAEEKDAFLSVASHELKTPLTSLTASLQLLDRLQPDKTTPFGKMLAQANRSLQKLNRLVTDLLNVRRIATGNLPLNRSRFSIGQLIADCCLHFRHEGHDPILLEGEKHLQVFADAQKIEQVIVNLINNAVKYSPKSGCIYISIGREADMARIVVRDEGPGIPADKLPHIFERYYRSGNHNVSGLGLGLYIVSEIIHQHGGELGVESEVGKGSSFWFTLPLN